MRNTPILSLIIAAALLTGAGLIVVKTEPGAPSPLSQSGTDKTIPPITPSHRKNSKNPSGTVARSIRAILLEKPPAVDRTGELPFDLSQFFKASELIPKLSSSGCLSLIEEMETEELPDDLLVRLYERMGELDPQPALARLGENPDEWPEDSPQLAKLQHLLIGWSTHDPDNAWALLRKTGTAEQNIFTGGWNSGVSPTSSIFHNWSRLDHVTAFQKLSESPPQIREIALRGYLEGLPSSLDFRHQAELISKFTDSEKKFRLAQKWMDQDPDQAADYWLLKKPELLQQPSFITKALPALAQESPQNALALIRQVDSLEQQTKLLVKGLQEPPASPVHFLHETMTSAFTPEMIQKEIESSRFTGQNLIRLKEAVKRRLATEAQIKN